MDLATATTIRDALRTAYLTGNQVGSYMIEGRSITYRSLQELGDALDRWERTVDELTAASRGKNKIPRASWNGT